MSDAPAYENISLTISGTTATITLDRPDHLNAFNVAMLHELLDAFDRTDADDDVRVVVLTGRGRAFCAGADLSGGGETFAGHTRDDGSIARDGGGLLTLRIYDSLKPVIAAINGSAVGVGLTMTLPCDARLVADNAKLAFPFAGRGIVTDAASAWFLPRVVGISQATEWCLTARRFGAEDALAARLVRSVHKPDDVLPAAYALADEMAAGVAPLSAVITRQLLWRSLGADHPMFAHEIESRAIGELGATADAREGVMAFLEKRQPNWALRPSIDLPSWFPFWEDRPYRSFTK
jgi:enoyl-CoA hydratase/carnithine racemase